MIKGIDANSSSVCAMGFTIAVVNQQYCIGMQVTKSCHMFDLLRSNLTWHIIFF